MWKRVLRLMLFAAMATGCNSAGDFPVALAGGRVVCEGKGVANVFVYFEPLETGKSAIVGRPAFAVTQADGTFKLSTYGIDDGAVIGKHRVRVGPPNREDHPNFTCPCILNSELDVMQVEVKKGQKNDFEVVLKKRTGREPPPLTDD